MGIFDGYLICTDCDGTMTDSKGQLSAENAEAIRYFQREGGLFTLSTGRFPKHVSKFEADFQPNTYQIVSNGTTIYDVEHDRVLQEITLTPPPREALEYIIQQGLCHLIFVDHLRYSDCWYSEKMAKLAEAGKARQPEGTTRMEDLLKPSEEAWHKVNFCFLDPEETVRVQQLMKEKFPQYKFERSWATGMELLPAEGGKGPAVLQLKKMLGDQVRRVIAVGDYENDVSMLEAADVGYAVANATELCLQAADRVTVDHDHHAIAAIIHELEEEL